MSKRLLFVFNPRSGKGRIKNSLFEVVDIFTKAGYEVTVYPTQSEMDCAEKIKNSAEKFDIVVVSGGDGTLNETVSGMICYDRQKRVPIGYLPAGTMNDFASGNGIPRSFTEAADAIVKGDTVSYDIGDFNGEKFIYVAAFGAFTDVSYDTPQTTKNILGNAAYLLEGIKRINTIEDIGVRIETAEGEIINEEVIWCFIMNSSSVAGIEVGDFYDINTNDGMFEIVLIYKSLSIVDLASKIADIRNGKRYGDGVRVITTKGAIIDTEKPVRWTLDGEYGGETSHVEFSVMHNAVDFILNK
jgi:YegS/Rv2252/BmrU family lipid kinase